MDIQEEKFLMVIQNHKKIIYKICHSYCPVAEDRKDLEQEIVLQLWKSFDRYNAQYKLSTWLYRIALNVAISFHRKEKKRRYHANVEDQVIYLTTDWAQQEALTENMQLLYQFINQLDAMHRALMILYLDNHSHEEISEILGISESNVGTKISRVKQKLKQQFSKV